jgi:hypothetical protein
VNTIYNMISQGRLTKWDGLCHIGQLVRFDPEVVKRRIREGRFLSGLNDDGKPVVRSSRSKPAAWRRTASGSGADVTSDRDHLPGLTFYTASRPT